MNLDKKNDIFLYRLSLERNKDIIFIDMDKRRFLHLINIFHKKFFRNTSMKLASIIFSCQFLDIIV